MAVATASFTFAPRENPEFPNEKYYMMEYTPSKGLRTNFKYQDIDDITVDNLRATDFTLARDGMELVRFDTKMAYEDYCDDAKVEKVYCDEVSRFMKKKLGAKDVFVFGYLVRRTEQSFPFLGSKPFEESQPAIVVHIDHSAEDIQDRIRSIFKDKADEYLRRNYKVINMWRPIKGPVRDWPMAYCDPTTVKWEQDVTAIDDIKLEHVNETLNLHHNPDQRWYYVPNQMPEEAVVFTQYDSRRMDASVPHCAFRVDGSKEASNRESIEIRCLVFD